MSTDKTEKSFVFGFFLGVLFGSAIAVVYLESEKTIEADKQLNQESKNNEPSSNERSSSRVRTTYFTRW